MTERTINIIDPATGNPVDVDGNPAYESFSAKALQKMSEQLREKRFGDDVPQPGAELPVRVSQDWSTDPVEGEQGSYTDIVEIEDGCPVCGYDRAKVTVHTLSDEYMKTCNACGEQLGRRGGDQ